MAACMSFKVEVERLDIVLIVLHDIELEVSIEVVDIVSCDDIGRNVDIEVEKPTNRI